MWALVIVSDYLQTGRAKRCSAYIVRRFQQVRPTYYFPRTCAFAAVALLLNPLFLEDPEGGPPPRRINGG